MCLFATLLIIVSATGIINVETTTLYTGNEVSPLMSGPPFGFSSYPSHYPFMPGFGFGGVSSPGLGLTGTTGGSTSQGLGFRRRCPVCDSSVYSYCSDKLFHDSCCCHNPNNPYDRLPYQCQFADCGFLHANTCQEHKLISACCCTGFVFRK